MPEYGNSEQERQQQEFETVVKTVLRDAINLFESQDRTEFTTPHQAENKFITYAIDIYAVQSVSWNIVDEPANPRPIIKEYAAYVFKKRYLDNNSGTDIPIS
jgi:hypothetical protein